MGEPRRTRGRGREEKQGPGMAVYMLPRPMCFPSASDAPRAGAAGRARHRVCPGPVPTEFQAAAGSRPASIRVLNVSRLSGAQGLSGVDG